MARRIIVAIVAAAIGAALYVAGFSRWLAIAAGIGILALADRLGLLPPAFEQNVRDILYAEPDTKAGGKDQQSSD